MEEGIQAISVENSNKHSKVKKIIIISIIIFVVIIIAIASILAYSIFGPNKPIKSISELDISAENPLKGFKVIFEKKPDQVNVVQTEDGETQIYLEDIEITPEFAIYLLQAVGANQILKKSVLAQEAPIINFKVEGVEYTAVLEDEIIISQGLDPEADIQFNSEKEPIVRATLNDDPAEIFKESINEGTTTIDTIAGDMELATKGYLDFYESLK